jgi:hypothetical protein
MDAVSHSAMSITVYQLAQHHVSENLILLNNEFAE